MLYPTGKEGALCSHLIAMGIDTVQKNGMQGTESSHQPQRVTVLLGTEYSPMLKTRKPPQLHHQPQEEGGNLSAVHMNQLRAIWDNVGTQATRSRKVTLKAWLA